MARTGLYEEEAILYDGPFFIPCKLLVVLASSTSDDQQICENVTRIDHHPMRIGDERERLVAASPVTKKCWGPS
jgi:hypothetical protein